MRKKFTSLKLKASTFVLETLNMPVQMKETESLYASILSPNNQSGA